MDPKYNQMHKKVYILYFFLLVIGIINLHAKVLLLYWILESTFLEDAPSTKSDFSLDYTLRKQIKHIFIKVKAEDFGRIIGRDSYRVTKQHQH